MQEFKNRTFIGIVEDNNDPKRLGRCRVRVLNVFDQIPVEDIPWASPRKDTNGNSAFIPDKGKVLSVVFDEGNPYKPEYICAEHYNINLEQKLQNLGAEDYVTMRALLFDHRTQIYSNESEGLKLDHKFNNINITKSSIDLNLKDNHGKVNLGSSIAAQQAILGNHFLDWFDKFIEALKGIEVGPFIIGGNGFVPTPALAELFFEYDEMRDEKFLSHHVSIVDNQNVGLATLVQGLQNWAQGTSNTNERIANSQIGDAWKSTKFENELTSNESVNFAPQPGSSTDSPQTTEAQSTAATPQSVVATEAGDYQKVLDALSKKGYIVYEKPFQLNIVAVRKQYEGTKYTNAFNDELYVIYKNFESKWVSVKYKITTMPGYYMGEERESEKDADGKPKFLVAKQKFSDNVEALPILSNKQSTRSKDNGGLTIVRTSQLLDNFELKPSAENPEFLANKTDAVIPIYLDVTSEDIINYSIGKEGIQYTSLLKLNKGPENGITVDTWSNGDFIFQSALQFQNFLTLCKRHRDFNQNSFTLTLIEERDMQVSLIPETIDISGTTTSTAGMTLSNINLNVNMSPVNTQTTNESVITPSNTTTTESQNQAEVPGSKPIADLTTATSNELKNRIDFLKREIEKLESKATLDPQTGIPGLSSADFKKIFDLQTELANVRDVKNKRFGYF